MLVWLLITVGALLALTAIGVALAHRFFTHRVRGDYLDAGGLRLHYTDEGDRAAEAVVLLHGFAVHADLNWRRPGIVGALAAEFRVVAMDLRGHGLSDKPHDSERYGLELVHDVRRLLDHLQIERAHLVGYSLGGFVALKAAAMFSERWITASALGAGWEPPENSTLLGAIPQLEEALRSGGAIGPLAGHLGGDRAKPGIVHTLWVKLMTRFFNDHRALIGVVRGLPSLALSEVDLRHIPVPVCSIVGSRDPLKTSAEAMVGRVEDHTLILVEGADHIRTPTRAEMRDGLLRFLVGHRDG